MKHNYGTLEIKRSSDHSIEIYASVKTLDNKELFNRKFTVGKR